MIIEITEPSFSLKITEWDEVTKELFKAYSDWKLGKNIDPVTKPPNVDEGKTTTQIIEEEISPNLADRKIQFRAPNNTALFLNWLESNHITEFETADFVDAYTSMNLEAAEKIISHQIHKNIITQLGNNSFKVNWTKLKEELK